MKEEEPIGPNPSDEQAFRVAWLVAGFLRHTLTDAQQIELDNWVTASMDNQRLFEKLIDEKNLDEWQQQKEKVDTTAALENIKSKISFRPKRKSAERSVWLYAAAACILAGIMFTFLLISKNQFKKQPDMVQTKPADIAPGADRATLRLSDGTLVRLDAIKNGNLTTQGNTHITKLDSGQLAYQQVNPTALPQAESYNTLSTPAGGQYKVILPDGTKVWLNASSSLKYPTVFGGAKRMVELTGEGYFEVAKDPMFPFEVKVNGAVVQVLGTHFNVNGYADEPDTKVVLAEGSVRFNNFLVLKPGEAAALSKNGNMSKGRADTEQALAWKNGQFVFKETPIDVLMRQVARWYNAEIIYGADIKDHFNATISRDTPVSRLLHLLEATGEVHFSIEGNKITVMK